jgi:hypothetical protein
MAKGAGTGTAVLLLLPIVIYSSAAYSLLMLGAYALIEDHSVVNNVCGTTYHFWKFAFLNMLLWLFTTVSYCLWKGGGEGARARALVLTIMYWAFFTWGALLWNKISDACADVMNQQFHILYLFHHVCTVMNGITACLLVLHEAWLGKYVGADLTVKPDLNFAMKTPYDVSTPTTRMQGGPQQAGVQSAHPPTNLSPQLSYEYEKIMQNNSSSILPQTTP